MGADFSEEDNELTSGGSEVYKLEEKGERVKRWR